MHFYIFYIWIHFYFRIYFENNLDIYKNLSRSRWKKKFKSYVYFTWQKNDIPAVFFFLRATLEFYFRPCWSDPDNVTEAYIPAMCVHSAKHVAKESRGLSRLALTTNDRSRGGIKVLNDENSEDTRPLKYPIVSRTLFEALRKVFFKFLSRMMLLLKSTYRKGGVEICERTWEISIKSWNIIKD